MSLYNNIAASLASGNLLGSIRSGISSTVGGAASQAAAALGGGRTVTALGTVGTNVATSAAEKLINDNVSQQAQRLINVGGGAIGDLMHGDWDAAGMRLLSSGLLNQFFPGASGIASQMAYWGTPTPLFGGISPAEAKAIYDRLRGEPLSKKNLWLIETVSSPLHGDIAERFNLFATEIEYTPYTVAGEKRKVGGSTIDVVQGTEPTELRITTLDDQTGTLRRWFKGQHSAVAAGDGTVGVPSDYLIKFKIVHSFITSTSNAGGYEDIGQFRPVSMDLSLSRREDGLQEIQMTFTQLDSFMEP